MDESEVIRARSYSAKVASLFAPVNSVLLRVLRYPFEEQDQLLRLLPTLDIHIDPYCPHITISAGRHLIAYGKMPHAVIAATRQFRPYLSSIADQRNITVVFEDDFTFTTTWRTIYTPESVIQVPLYRTATILPKNFGPDLNLLLALFPGCPIERLSLQIPPVHNNNPPCLIYPPDPIPQEVIREGFLGRPHSDPEEL